MDDDPERHRQFRSWLEPASQPQLARWPHALWPHDNKMSRQPIQAAHTVEEALAILRQPARIEIAFLDHDLDGRTFVEERAGTGTEVADFIAALPASRRPRRIIVHSFNPEGAQRMLDVLLACGCQADAMPFGSGEFMRAGRIVEVQVLAPRLITDLADFKSLSFRGHPRSE